MLLAWKNAHRFEASTFLLMASVCAPLPSVSDNARNKAITAISNAIFLFEPEACSACSACSMLSCAPMIPLQLTAHDCRTAMRAQEASLRGHRCDGSVSAGRTGVHLRGCALLYTSKSRSLSMPV